MLLTPSEYVVLNVNITPNFGCDKVGLGMLQIEKPVILHERAVTSFTRTELSALQIETLACNEILT